MCRSRRSSADAQRHGIAAIYQEPTIYPDLNVAENIFMGHRDRGVMVRWGRMYREAETIRGVSLGQLPPGRHEVVPGLRFPFQPD